MKLSKKEVKKIAQLARLEISEKDIGYYAEELSAVLGYVEQLEKVDTQKIEPLGNISGLDSIYRKDEEYDTHLKRRLSTPEILMKLVPFKEKGMVKVKSVFNKTDL